MKYFLDTEFIEDGKTIDLISVGIVAEDGRELYLQSSDCSWWRASEWVKQNVLPHLLHFNYLDCEIEIPKDAEAHPTWSADGTWKTPWTSHSSIAAEIVRFIGDDSDPQFWGYYADYDWVVFCQLFGTMMDLPKGFPMYCRDIKQLCDDLGNPKLPEQGKGEHHALADARWNKEAWLFLTSLEGK